MELQYIDIDKNLLKYKCAIVPETFSGEFKYSVFKFGNNGISAWLNEDIGFISKTTVYINRSTSWYDSRKDAYDSAIKWLEIDNKGDKNGKKQKKQKDSKNVSK